MDVLDYKLKYVGQEELSEEALKIFNPGSLTKCQSYPRVGEYLCIDGDRFVVQSIEREVVFLSHPPYVPNRTERDVIIKVVKESELT